MSFDVHSVLMTADAVGGVWTYAIELGRALATRGVRVTLAVMGPRPSAAQRAEVRSTPWLSLAEAPYRLEWMEDPWADVDFASAWLVDLERDLRPDVVHLNGYAHGCVPFFAPVVAVGHSCVLSWFDQVKGEAAPPRYDEYRRRVARGLRCASLVVAPTAAMLGFLQRFHGPLPACRVIHNAVRLETAPPELKEPFVLAAGRVWDEAKNVSTLDAAASGVPWPVYVAGETRSPDGTILAARATRLLGPIPRAELRGWMQRAAIFAAPALYEPFGLGVLEAARSGCALLLSDIASFRELWDGCAEFVDPRDLAAIASSLWRLASDPLRRTALAVRARARAEMFDPLRMADAYLDAYRTVRHEPRGAVA